MKKYLRSLAIASAVALGLLAVAPVASRAQAPSVPGPYNIDLGQVLAFTNLIASTAYSPTGSGYSATPVNLAYKGLSCRLTVTGESGSGSPTIAWGIQQYDAASASWTTAVAAAGTTAATSQTIDEAPGIATSGLQSGWTALNLNVPRVWRVYVTTTGAGLGATGQVGCNFTQ